MVAKNKETQMKTRTILKEKATMLLEIDAAAKTWCLWMSSREDK